MFSPLDGSGVICGSSGPPNYKFGQKITNGSFFFFLQEKPKHLLVWFIIAESPSFQFFIDREFYNLLASLKQTYQRTGTWQIKNLQKTGVYVDWRLGDPAGAGFTPPKVTTVNWHFLIYGGV